MWLWALLPVCYVVFGTAGLWTVFGIAVSNGSVNLTEEFPFISKCGSYNPQSCLFSQICNICSVLVLWIVVIRFQQVRDYGQTYGCHGKANISSIVLGFISSIGISILGNFQQTVLMKVHILGAFLAFVLGLAYFWVQLWLTYYTEPSQDRRLVGPVRAICCIACTLLAIGMAVLLITQHLTGAAVCEWAMVMVFFCLFGLFAADFRHIDCHQFTVQRPGAQMGGGDGGIGPPQFLRELNHPPHF